MTTIGEKTIGSASRLLDALLKKHAPEIDSAYIKEEGAFTVNMSLKFKPDDDGGIEMEVGIAFVKDRVKDSVKGRVQESMDGLFDAIEKGKMSVTIGGKTFGKVISSEDSLK
jgi:hypothetical protein